MCSGGEKMGEERRGGRRDERSKILGEIGGFVPRGGGSMGSGRIKIFLLTGSGDSEHEMSPVLRI